MSEDHGRERVSIVEPALLIRIPRLYRDGMSSRALYDATRGVWKIGSRRNAARYAFAVKDGLVREVYEIHEWLPAGSTEYESRGVTPTSHPGRWEFVGRRAPERVRERYVGKSVAHYFANGAQNPIRYVNVRSRSDSE